jgi:hypothetical protein
MAPAKALTDRRARHVHELAFEVMVGDDFLTDIQQVVGLTRNSTTLRLGSTLALAKWPRIGLGQTLGLGHAGAELHGGVAVFSLGGPLGHHLQLSSFRTVTGICFPSSMKSRVMPSFLCDHS